MTSNGDLSVTVAGAGSVGCYAGGALALGGRNVTLLVRPRIAQALSSNGYLIRDLAGPGRIVPPNALRLETDPKRALNAAHLILVTVKSRATAEMAELIRTHARPGATVVSLQNGVRNTDVLRAHLGLDFKIAAGMVPFNVVQTLSDGTAASFVRATSGHILVDREPAGLVDILNVPGFPAAAHGNMPGVQWSKLVINLNNAINALCGRPLVEELADKRWRSILARQQRESLAVLRASGIRTVALDGVRPEFLPLALGLPDALFRRVARRMLAIDPAARSSMWEDLEQKRPTEIDELQGAIQRLAAAHNMPVPLTDRIVSLIASAEATGLGSPKLKPEDVWPLYGASHSLSPQ